MQKLIVTIVLFLTLTSVQAQMYSVKKSLLKSESYVRTNIEWTSIASKMTKNCESQEEKIKAIYLWICENIAYDTDFTIYHVDECWKARKGVCQAYCELFYCLTKAVGIESNIIIGIAKTNDNNYGGHAWIAVKNGEKTMLIDPTWGAGSVNGNVFTRKKNHSMWYDVDPHWMFFTHYPDDSRWQFLSESYTENDFRELPHTNPLSCIGLSGEKVLANIRNGRIKSLPTFYDISQDRFKIKNIPMTSTLTIGRPYFIKIRPETGVEWAVINEGKWYREWTQGEDGFRYMNVTPINAGKLKISVKRTHQDQSFYSVVEYIVKKEKITFNYGTKK